MVLNLEQPPTRRSWLVSLVWWLEAALEVRPMVKGLRGVMMISNTNLDCLPVEGSKVGVLDLHFPAPLGVESIGRCRSRWVRRGL